MYVEKAVDLAIDTLNDFVGTDVSATASAANKAARRAASRAGQRFAKDKDAQVRKLGERWAGDTALLTALVEKIAVAATDGWISAGGSD